MTGPKQHITDYFAKSPARVHTHGTILLRPDEPIEHVWYIERGRVIQYHIDHAGNKLIMNVYKPGAFFPAYLVVGGIPCDSFFEVDDSNTILRRITAQEARDMLANNPEIMMDLFARFSRGVSGVLRRLSIHMSGTAQARLAVEMIIAARRFAEQDATGHYVLRTTASQLAAHTGVARETVSRELGKFHEHNLVTRHGRELHINLPALEAYLDTID